MLANDCAETSCSAHKYKKQDIQKKGTWLKASKHK